jgi:hypothetical protein
MGIKSSKKSQLKEITQTLQSPLGERPDSSECDLFRRR